MDDVVENGSRDIIICIVCVCVSVVGERRRKVARKWNKVFTFTTLSVVTIIRC